MVPFFVYRPFLPFILFVMKFLLPVLALTLIGCSQMVWRQAQLAEEISPSNDPNTNLLLTVTYEEKDSWNPLNGTTDKRNYKSKIKLVKNSATGGKTIKEWDLPSWALGDGIFYHTGSSTLFVLYGKDDEYGTLNQTLSLYPESGGAFSYPASPEKRIIFQMAPSPNGNLVALVTASPTNEGEFSEFELNIIQLSDKKSKVFRSTSGPPSHSTEFVGEKMEKNSISEPRTEFFYGTDLVLKKPNLSPTVLRSPQTSENGPTNQQNSVKVEISSWEKNYPFLAKFPISIKSNSVARSKRTQAFQVLTKPEAPIPKELRQVPPPLNTR